VIFAAAVGQRLSAKAGSRCRPGGRWPPSIEGCDVRADDNGRELGLLCFAEQKRMAAKEQVTADQIATVFD